MHYLLLCTTMLILGGIPIFGPPLWIFAAFFRHHYHLTLIPVVLLSAISFTLGRLLLAFVMEGVTHYLPKRYTRNLEHIKTLLEKRQKNTWIVLLTFFLAPFPSAQLFEAAGFIRLPFLPISLVFFLGRALSLILYLSLIHLTNTNIHSLWHAGFASVWGITAEIIALICLVAFFRLDWFIKRLSK